GVRLILDRSLSELAYRCWPDGCPRDRTCCVGLVVETSRREVRVIASLMDGLAALLPRLHDGDAFASVFVEDPPGYVIESSEDGGCPFLWRTRRHALGAIHTPGLRPHPAGAVSGAADRDGDGLRRTARPLARTALGPGGVQRRDRRAVPGEQPHAARALPLAAAAGTSGGGGKQRHA